MQQNLSVNWRYLPSWAVVVALLVERSLPTSEVRCSNPVIGKKLKCAFTVIFIEKTKIKKQAGIGPFKKRFKVAHINLPPTGGRI